MWCWLRCLEFGIVVVTTFVVVVRLCNFFWFTADFLHAIHSCLNISINVPHFAELEANYVQHLMFLSMFHILPTSSVVLEIIFFFNLFSSTNWSRSRISPSKINYFDLKSRLFQKHCIKLLLPNKDFFPTFPDLSIFLHFLCFFTHHLEQNLFLRSKLLGASKERQTSCQRLCSRHGSPQRASLQQTTTWSSIIATQASQASTAL